MKVKKTFGAPAPIKVVIAAPASGDTATLVITLPDNPSNYRTLNLIPWLGRGIDAWVWACANQLRTFFGKRVGYALHPSWLLALGHEVFFRILGDDGHRSRAAEP